MSEHFWVMIHIAATTLTAAILGYFLGIIEFPFGGGL